MAEKIVVGVFSALGEATNARHRLEYEGVPAADIAVRVLKETEKRPESLAPGGVEGPFDWLFGTDLPGRYVDIIHNGETALAVRARSDEEAEVRRDIVGLFQPLRVEVIEVPQAETLAPRPQP
jgi:hypothetical protein